MKTESQKFLEFNGKTIYFISVDGQFWIALKPICEALGVDWKNQHGKLQNGTDIFGQLSSERGIVAADNRIRKMTCLEERYVYGWLFSIQFSNTMSAETRINLSKYKIECCDILFNHFHGTITGRKELLSEKAKAQIEMDQVMNSLSPENALKYEKAKRRKDQLTAHLRDLDGDFLKEEKDLFNQ
jgi:hypothetical protein